jgi:exodeoxyribonuclease VII small subunit
MAKSTSPKTATETAPAALAPLPETYELALQELERLIAALESGQLPLDELLSSYQRGAQLMTFCKSKLAEVENQIKVLDGNELKNWSAAK